MPAHPPTPFLCHCITPCLPRCHCITRCLFCCTCLHCRFSLPLSLPHLSYITTLHSHITEIHAPWRPRTFHLPRLLHAFACLYMALRSTADFETFCTQVGLRGGVQRVHKHTRHGGVSWRGRGRQPIRQAPTSTAISASVFQPERLKPTSTASPTSTSWDGFGTNFCYRNKMRDSAQGLVLQLVEAFLSRSATYKPTHSGRLTAHRSHRLGTVFREVSLGRSPSCRVHVVARQCRDTIAPTTAAAGSM
jgi:hypothetical protein